MEYAATVVAKLLDPKNNGTVKYEDLRREMSASGSSKMMLGGGSTELDEKTCHFITGQEWTCKPLELYNLNSKNRRSKFTFL